MSCITAAACTPGGCVCQTIRLLLLFDGSFSLAFFGGHGGRRWFSLPFSNTPGLELIRLQPTLALKNVRDKRFVRWTFSAILIYLTYQNLPQTPKSGSIAYVTFILAGLKNGCSGHPNSITSFIGVFFIAGSGSEPLLLILDSLNIRLSHECDLTQVISSPLMLWGSWKDILLRVHQWFSSFWLIKILLSCFNLR